MLAQPLPDENLTRRDWCWAWLAALAAVLLCVAFANRSGFWLDEWYTYGAARLPWGEIFTERRVNGHTPLHYYYVKLFWLVSHNQVWLRFSSALLVGASLLLATGLAGALRMRRILPGLWLLGVLHPYLLSVGLEFRYMSALIAFALGCAWLAVRYSEGWAARHAVVLALLSTVFLWLHASVLFIGATLALFLVLESRAQAGGPLWRWLHWRRAWPLLLAIALSLPMVLIVHDNRGLTEPQPPDFKMVLEDFCQLTLGDHLLWPRALQFDEDYALIALTAVLVGVLALGLRGLSGAASARARRLLLSWFLGAPVLFFAYSAVVRSLQGPARYLCTLSAAALFLLALSWHYPFGRAWQRTAWRTLLLAIVAIQAAGTLLDRGDLQREAVQWILAQQPADAPIFLNSFRRNQLAFDYYGLKDERRLDGVSEMDPLVALRHPETPPPDLTAEGIAARMRQQIGNAPRVFCLFYHHKGKQADAIKLLEQQGVLKATRLFRPSWWTIVVVGITREEDRPWLDALRGPETPWGPAHGHKKFNPVFERPAKVARY